MAGGAGTRFWPLSTEERPKQFLSLLGERSLLQETYRRALSLCTPARVLVLTADVHVAMVHEQLPDLPRANVIGEPMRRDTAAAVCLAALVCRARFGDCVMVILTADHFIEPLESFVVAMRSAARAAEATGALYTLGVHPTCAAVCYGYLRRGAKLMCDGEIEHTRLEAFREKPDLATAVAYVSEGCYCWNSGMFVWMVSTIMREFAQHLPQHLEYLSPVVGADGSVRLESLREAFAQLPSLSIDYGIMEKSDDVRMVVAPFAWSDVGGWSALAEFLEDDGRGNRYRGRLMTLEAAGNVVYAEDPDELIALVGIENLIVVRAGGCTLVAGRDQAEDVKLLVAQLKGVGPEAQGRGSAGSNTSEPSA
jgi:mannose-1-phosphate guanylyltransferase